MRTKTVIAVIFLVALSACTTRSHIRGCELAHPYHDSNAPTLFVVPDGLKKPQARATFHVPDQRHLAPKAGDLVTEEDVENLSKEQLKAKRCIMSPPRLMAAPADDA